MTLDLSTLEGALRTRIEEPEWAALYQAVVPPDRQSTLAPLPVEGPVALPPGGVPDPTREAVRLATGQSAAIILELTSIGAGRGVLAALGTDGVVGGSVVRAMVVPDPPAGTGADGVVLAPGVEISGFRIEQLVAEVIRLLPPEGPLAAPAEPGEPIRLAAEWAMILARAVQEHDEPMLREVARECGWDEVPDLLVSLAEEVRANATIAIRVAGSARVGVRRWLLCHLGWVSVQLADGYLTHRLCSREQIREELVYDLTGALDAVLGEVSGVG